MPSCYLFVPLMTLKKNDLLVVGGRVGVGGEKNLFCLGFSKFLQCNRVFGCL